MKSKKDKKTIVQFYNEDACQEISYRELLIEKIKVDSYFSPNDIRFVQSSKASN